MTTTYAAIEVPSTPKRRPLTGVLWAGAIGLVLAVVTLAAVASFGSYHLTRVLSNSMSPTFGVGDYALVQDRSTSTLAVGQVVVLPEPSTDAFYIHRLLTVTHPGGATTVSTKGDNNPAPDAWTLNVTSATVPVYVAHLSMHGVTLPTSRPGTAQMLLGAGLALTALTLVRPRRRAGSGATTGGRSPEELAESDTSMALGSPDGGGERAGRSILIVDEDPDMLALLEFTFQAGRAWTVRTASSMAEAASALSGAEDIDVVLTDDHLTDGCAADLRDAAGRRPVVLLSTSLDAPPSTLVTVAGFAGGISKPFNPLTTPDLVADAVKKWQARA
jgi:signal peptidase I